MKRPIPTNGGTQEMLFIPEGDVYRLITRSKLPAAERVEILDASVIPKKLLVKKIYYQG